MSDKALRSAISRGKTDEAARLLAENPGLASTVHPLFGTFIGQAAAEGHTAIVTLLLNAGCPVDLVSRRSSAALYLAVAGRHDETERLLLSRGAAETAEIQGLRDSIRFVEATAEGRKVSAISSDLNDTFFETFHENKKKWLSEQSGEALGWLYENAINLSCGLRYESHITQTFGPGEGYGSPDEQCSFVLDYLNTTPRRIRGWHRS
jgi:hypothetical protein